MREYTNRDRVIQELKRYPQKQRRADLLRYELAHPPNLSEQEVIEELALSPAADGAAPSGHISNKTMQIALQFREATQRMNEEAVLQISQELYTLEADIQKIDYYISLLNKQDAAIIQASYMTAHLQAPSALAAEFGLAKRALTSRRNAALDELAEMFAFVEEVRSPPKEENA